MTENIQDTPLEHRVYSGWAFTTREAEKAQINRSIYNKIKDQAVLTPVGRGYGHTVYKIVSNPRGLNIEELALIADSGNLCFGYRRGTAANTLIIHTD